MSKNAARTRAPKSAPVAAPEPTPAPPAPTRKPRISKFAGKVLFFVPTDVIVREDGSSPNNGADARRTKGSRRTFSRNLLREAGEGVGLSFDRYLALGGNAGDLARDVRKGATLALSPEEAEARRALYAAPAPVEAEKPARKRAGKGK